MIGMRIFFGKFFSKLWPAALDVRQFEDLALYNSSDDSGEYD